MTGAARVVADSRGPVARGLDEDRLRLSGEGLVARPGEIAIGGPGHVGGDVFLDAAGADGDDLAAGHPADLRRDVEPRTSRLPGEARPRASACLCRGSSWLRSEEPVAQDRARRGWVSSGEEREREDVGVPEDVAVVPGARKTAGADRLLAAVRRSRH